MNKKLDLLIATSQLNSSDGKQLGTGTIKGISQLAGLMKKIGIHGDILDLPNGSQKPNMASPFSLNNGFALKTDELDVFAIPELKSDPRLLKHVQQISNNFSNNFKKKRVVDYALKRSVMPWVIHECFQLFKEKTPIERLERYNSFLSTADFWLEEYVLFELYVDRDISYENPVYRDMESDEVKSLIKKHQDDLDRYRYTQFLCYEQRQALKKSLSELGIRLIVNLPFGVELESADVHFHPEVFDTSVQVGCSPEPEHGYPEQAWGIAAYREKSSGLKRYLIEKTRWLSLLGDGVFIDHMVGWCGQYVLPMVVAEDSVYPHGHFLTENQEERMENIRWVLDLFLDSGLTIKGEIAGDINRVKATRSVVENLISDGKDIVAMVIPRWEKTGNKIKPLSDYSPNTLTMVETHDTSTLLQYLLNKKGYDDDFESIDNILEFCNRVLALPFFHSDLPLKVKRMTDDVWFEICRRLVEGVPSNEIVFTVPGLISMLTKEFRSASIENNINVKPGTSGLVGNGWGNWSYFSPPIEALMSDPFIYRCLRQLGQRVFKPFDHFHHLAQDDGPLENLSVIYSHVKNRKVIYRNESKVWSIWNGKSDGKTEAIDLELVISNYSDTEVWQRIDLSAVLDLERSALYSFQDLNGDQACYTYAADDLLNNRLFIKLMPRQIHHFLVYTNWN